MIKKVQCPYTPLLVIHNDHPDQQEMEILVFDWQFWKCRLYEVKQLK